MNFYFGASSIDITGKNFNIVNDMGVKLNLAEQVDLLIGIGIEENEEIIEALPFLDAALAKLNAETRQYLVALHCCHLTTNEIEQFGGWNFGECSIMRCDGKNNLVEMIASAIREQSANDRGEA